MASLTTRPDGSRFIQFTLDKQRRTIHLGMMTEKKARGLADKVEAIASAKKWGGQLDDDIARWLVGLPDALHEKLADVELVKPRADAQGAQLGAFIEEYLRQRQADVKPGTMLVMVQAKRTLLAFMGEDEPVDSVTSADADAYRAHLLERMSKATVVKWCRYARHYFDIAKRRKLVDENPFGHIKGAIHGNPARRVFVPAEDVLKVLDAAPDAQWKLLIALARWGGLRIPSEALALKWGDVDWAHDRFIVRATKTEHHQDGGIRIVPIFPEIRPHLQRVFDEAEAGTEFVITKYRNTVCNLRTQFMRYIEAAGLKPWGKPWQNMRSTRATELADAFPSHVCAAWLGHTEAIANEFYRQVTDAHFAKAVAEPTQNALQKAQRKAQQYPPELARTGKPEKEKNPVFPGDTASYDLVQECDMGDKGFEPLTSTL